MGGDRQQPGGQQLRLHGPGDDIEDYPGNQTRFVMLSTEPAPQDLDAPYKTSIVCTIAHDQPGSLLQILQEFAHRYVNLTKIESRPSKKGLGDYVFFIDVEGRKDDEQVAAAIKCLECKLASVKMLGSYPVGLKALVWVNAAFSNVLPAATRAPKSAGAWVRTTRGCDSCPASAITARNSSRST